MNSSSLVTSLPILTSCLFGSYVGMSFIYPSAINLIESQTWPSSQTEFGWISLGLIFIVVSVIHIVKFIDLGNRAKRTRLMFTASRDSVGVASAYATVFFFLSGLVTYFMVIKFDVSTSSAEELACGLLAVVNFSMGVMKLKETMRSYRKNKPAYNF